MTAAKIYLIPGETALWLILSVLDFRYGDIHTPLFTVFAALLSWIIWCAILKIVWNITLRIFGFDRRGRY